jgi:WD40 repeat protein
MLLDDSFVKKNIVSACFLLLLIALSVETSARQTAPSSRAPAKPEFTLTTGHKGNILAVVFSPDRRWLAVLCSADRSVFLGSLPPSQ